MAASITSETIYERRASDDQFREQFAQVHSYCKPSKVETKEPKPEPKDTGDDVNVEEDDNPVYCICRTSDTSRFMIGCDNCNEWYHGDCISITEQYAQNILKFFCLLCRNRNPSLKNIFKNDKRYKGGCGQCSSCLRLEDCEHCEGCREFKRFGAGKGCLKRQCIYKSSGSSRGGGGRSRKNAAASSRDYLPDSDEESYQPHRGGKRKRDAYRDDDEYVPETKVSRGGSRKSSNVLSEYQRTNRRAQATRFEPAAVTSQCYGPGCTNSARSGSKYCSDECGILLARHRIFSILPTRIQQWQSVPCRGDEMNRKQLENIRKQQQAAKEELQRLEERKVQLEELIERSKRTPIKHQEDPQQGDEEFMVYCITCGHEVNARTSVRHMERCFMRFESQTSYGSIFKTMIGSQVFCDTFNPSQNTYCKRLKVLCPEHTKDPKVDENEVCGCPLYRNVFEETGKFCDVAKKKCMRHYCWEKFRRAEIDMEVVRLWLKLDELVEQERSNRTQITNRGGVLGLLLHQTNDHDPSTTLPTIDSSSS